MCDAFRDDTEYQFMTGGQWVAHPGNAPAIYRVRIGPVPHVSTGDMADFTIQSEQYYMHVDPGVTVHATTHVAIGRRLVTCLTNPFRMQSTETRWQAW